MTVVCFACDCEYEMKGTFQSRLHKLLLHFHVAQCISISSATYNSYVRRRFFYLSEITFYVICMYVKICMYINFSSCSSLCSRMCQQYKKNQRAISLLSAQKPKNTRKSHRKLMSFRRLFGLNFEDYRLLTNLMYLCIWSLVYIFDGGVIEIPKNLLFVQKIQAIDGIEWKVEDFNSKSFTYLFNFWRWHRSCWNHK